MPFPVTGLLSFIGIVTLLVMFPGPNTVLVMQSTGLYGKKAGFYNIAGIVSALYVHALVSAWGLSVIILKSLAVYNIIKYVGAGYIIYLGLASIYSAYSMDRSATSTVEGESWLHTEIQTEAAFQSYARGFITNIFNPKVALFFISFFPQFIRKENQFFGASLLLIIIYSIIEILWYSVLICFVAKFRSWLANKTIQRRIKALTGILLCGLGLKIAVQK